MGARRLAERFTQAQLDSIISDLTRRTSTGEWALKRDDVAKKWKISSTALDRLAADHNIPSRRGSASAAPTPPSNGHTERIPEGIFAYALGHIESWIETYAKSASVSGEALAAELGAVLHRKTRR